MHSTSYELENGQKVVVHHDGDCTGRAFWTIVENNETIVETIDDIEGVQHSITRLMEQDPSGTLIMISTNQLFPREAIINIIATLSTRRITYLIEDIIYNLNLNQLESLEKTLKDYINKGEK